jgi:hypothetical protein
MWLDSDAVMAYLLSKTLTVISLSTTKELSKGAGFSGDSVD